MNEIMFSIVLIARNESKTLPRLIESLKEFLARGGQCCLLDTGSTDNTVQVAKDAGFVVEEVGSKYLHTIDKQFANKINKRFLVDKDELIVKEGDNYFDFAAARNHAASLAKNDMIFCYDADEVAAKLDIDKINELIKSGVTQFEYNFVFAKDAHGNEAVKFIQSKAYNRTEQCWQGIIHELIVPIKDGTGDSIKRMFLDESIYKLEHYQNHETGRHTYLKGLAVDCYNHPNADRQSHYFARELFWNKRYKSAVKEFKRHIAMDRWHIEKAESMIYVGDCYGHLNLIEEQIKYYHLAFHTDQNRRSALLKLAGFYRHNNKFQAAVCFAKAALEIPVNGFYANNMSDYTFFPHEILYQSYGWLGNINAAREHLAKAMEYQPFNPAYLRDTKFYNEYGDNGIEGWMSFRELSWLYNMAKKYDNILEVGSWKGRSTHAICTGHHKKENPIGNVFAVDTWKGSDDERDHTNWMAKKEDIFEIFKTNTKEFFWLKPIVSSSVEAAASFADESLDAVFIDAGHRKEDLLEDVNAWLPKVKKTGMICGHDYKPDTWMGVVEGVDEIFGKPDGVEDSIWWVDLAKRNKEKLISINADALPAQSMEEVINEFQSIPLQIGNKVNQIPKKIFTAWLNPHEVIPELVSMCVKSQQIEGYDHCIIDIKQAYECYGHIPYVHTALNAKKWVKAVDYIRMYVLLHEGGIFLDADVEIISGKNFDGLLSEQMFVGMESNKNGLVVLGTAIIGAKAGHPLIKHWMEEVDNNFKGDDDKYYESSMHILNVIGVNYQDKFKLLQPDFFYPFDHFSNSMNVTENSITIHHFLKSWIPKQEKSLIEQFTDKINSGEHFSFVKRGDGEVACMNGDQGGNCDGHPYSKELGDGLTEAYEFLEKKNDVMIVDFENQKEYNTLLHRTDNDMQKVSAFYKAIVSSPRRKHLIAPARLAPMATIMGADHIIIPELNMFASIETVWEKMMMLKNRSESIWLFCAGMPAKILIRRLLQVAPLNTVLDCGSAFDPIAHVSRTFQISTDDFKSLYYFKKEHVKGNLDNFKIPQETHPERLFALEQIKGAKIVYDLGCGTHKTIDTAIGVDVRPVTDIQASIEELSMIKDNSGDAIISRHSLEHVLDPVKAIKEWMRILKPYGKMIIVLPDHESINTIDPIYSNGEHLHAFTRKSFANLISLFPDLNLHWYGSVLKDWSFGAVINYVPVQNLPKVSFIIPQLGREEGLQKCIDSINELNYPQDLIRITIVDGEDTVPVKVNKGYKASSPDTDVYVYAANDMTFDRNSLIEAVKAAENYGLVAFNTGGLLSDDGNICEHFLIRKDLVEKFGGEIFDPEFHHCGCDNLLWAKAKKINQAIRCDEAIVYHPHFSRGGQMDDVYKKGWSHLGEDRALLSKKLQEL